MINNIIIIGSGPAGLTAALYASREGYSPMLITGSIAGGQLLLTTLVENYPAFPEGVLGSDLIDKMNKQAQHFGTRFVSEDVVDIDFSVKPFKIKTNLNIYQTHALIIATGASAKWLEIESEKKFIGKGVSSCATCDGPFFRNKNVVVVGGGDTAMEDSLFLTKFANSVTILHRRDSFRASKIMQEKVLSNSKIKVIYNVAVEEIIGNDKITGIRIIDINSKKSTLLQTDGVFVAIGHKPNTEFLKGKLKLDQNGYIITTNEVFTEIEGLFVAGDVADHRYRQAITAASSGCKAALEARAYLNQKVF